MRLGTAVVVLLGGCNVVFGVDPDQGSDAPGSDASSCSPVLSNFDDFETPTNTPCSWGYLTQSACTATIANGALAMTPSAFVTDTLCICGTSTPLRFTSTFGTMAEVEQIGPQVGEYSVFTACDDATNRLWKIGYEPATTALTFTRDATIVGAIPWDPALRWWRIRPDDAGTAVLAEASIDGTRWMPIATDTVTPPMMVQVSFQEGTFASLPAPSTARLASINVCP